jgi:6-phosphogluconolactonase
VRTLQWPQGRAWLVPEADDEWPARLGLKTARALDRVHTLTLPATGAAPAGAVAVRLQHLTASGGSYSAALGGRLTPGGRGELAVTLRLGADDERPADVIAAIVSGLESVPDRPAGALDIWCPYVDPVDLEEGAWERCAATMLRLMASDAAALPADEASRLAREAASARSGFARPSPTAAVTPALFVADDVGALVEEVAARIRAAAASAVLREGRFRVALAGGSTPRALYPKLTDGVDWTRADIFFGDERVVPPDDPQSNYRMARETLLAPARVPDANVFRWRTESPDLDAAARDYEKALCARPVGPQLDLALLGLGPDGHTASLFPGTAALAVEDRLAVPVDVPKLNTRRLTLTYPAFLDARDVFFLVTGPDKRAALADLVRPGSTVPAARIAHRARSACIFCDREAAQDINAKP